MQVFVANRVQKIKSHTDIIFLYVSTKENPDGISTRRTNVQNLKGNHFWWHGPNWIKQDESTRETIYDGFDEDQREDDYFSKKPK